MLLSIERLTASTSGAMAYLLCGGGPSCVRGPVLGYLFLAANRLCVIQTGLAFVAALPGLSSAPLIRRACAQRRLVRVVGTSAQVVLAVYLNNNKDGIGLSGLEDFKNVQLGSLNVTPDKTGAVGADRVPPLLERYLTGLRISGPGNIAIKRS